MIKITLPDDRIIEVAPATNIKEVAAQIGKKLERDALVAEVDGKLVDLAYEIQDDAHVTILTATNPRGLEILRHSAAHLLAHAVTELFPNAQPTVGPAIEDGFYHDFYYPDGFTEEDLPKIEAKMHELASANYPITRTTKQRSEALDFYTKRNEQYKVKMIEDIPDEIVSFYKQGQFINACLGPHVPSTGYLKAFKLTKLSGAYWKGDAQNETLQRIYGTAWPTTKDLTAYLTRLELAKQRDHRIIGKKMDLFHLQEETPGMIFWHPKGWTIYSEIKRYLSHKLATFGYQEINTPMLLDRSLWEKSGHWDKYREIMFTTESEKRVFAIKPMNCPGHIQIFKKGMKSYRDLPLRFCEFGFCHRNEISGSLHGIMRVRGFVQDDGHIFCTMEQVVTEARSFIKQTIDVYHDFGFHEIIIKLSTRPAQRIGDDAQWDEAEQALTEVLQESGLKWQLTPGEGAFYGPKIEFSLRDSIGRVWQCGTLQMDLSMPERLDARYVTEDGSKKPVIILHRAMLGSIERFIGILLEDTGGNLPLWLAPVQVVVANITDEQTSYTKHITQQLQQAGYRVNYDLRNEKISFKIREHSIAKVPLLLIVGNKEMAANVVTVRTCSGKDLGQMSVEQLITDILAKK